MTHVSSSIFCGLFKNIVFRSVALVLKKLWAILDFFLTHSRLFTALYPFRKKKKNLKILWITIYEKSTNFRVIVSQIRVLGQKTREGGGRQRPPPPGFIGLNQREINGKWSIHHTNLKFYCKCTMYIVHCSCKIIQNMNTSYKQISTF